MLAVKERIVITGIGLTAPGANTLSEFRSNLLKGIAPIQNIPMRYMGEVHAGICDYDPCKYQRKKDLRTSTRAGSIAIYATNEAIVDSQLDWANIDKSRVGVYVGITEHGNVETENEIYNISQFQYDTKFWTHHHNPRTVANNPAGEITMNLNITGPHYTIGAACAAGNAGIIQGAQMLRLDEVDIALVGGVSESVQSFGIFAGFKSQGALAFHADPQKASRPFDMDRNGIVVSEGGCIYVLERLSDARKRGARIYGEVSGYCINSDAIDTVLPNSERQMQCMRQAIKSASLEPKDIHIVNTHATSTAQGDIQECVAIREVFTNCPETYINNTKSFIGHTMGAAGALELAGNLGAFEDNWVHPTINIDRLDPQCEMANLIINTPFKASRINALLNNSFGMLGINSTLIIKKWLD